MLKVIFSYNNDDVITGYGPVGSYSSTESTAILELTAEDIDSISNYPPMFLRYDPTTNTVAYDELLSEEFKLLQMELKAVEEERKAAELASLMLREPRIATLDEEKVNEELRHENTLLRNRLANLEDLVEELFQKLEQ